MLLRLTLAGLMMMATPAFAHKAEKGLENVYKKPGAMVEKPSAIKRLLENKLELFRT